MRILFLSNHFPPYSEGGYELWCHEVAVELGQRGHEICVLTSRLYDQDQLVETGGIRVYRQLHQETAPGLWRTAFRFFVQRRRLEEENKHQIDKLVADFRPDTAVIWGMGNLPRSVPARVEQLLPERVAYYLGDYWLSLPSAYAQYWSTPSGRTVTRLPKRLIGNWAHAKMANESCPRLGLKHPLCASETTRDQLVKADVPVSHARIIYGGVQLEPFLEVAHLVRADRVSGGLKMVYAGRLTPEKGVHTAIHALALVTDTYRSRVTLDIAGSGDQEYEAYLRSLVERYDLDSRIQFLGRVQYEDMPSLFTRYDTLVFPSEWEEPFGRSWAEAMAAGLVVIATSAGCPGEVLIEGDTALLFPPGEAGPLACQIQRLADDPALRVQLRNAASVAVQRRFAVQRMVGEIEDFLFEIASSRY